MLTIQREQHEVLSAAVHEKFFDSVRRLLRSVEPVEIARRGLLDASDFNNWAGPLLEQAFQWNLSAEDCVTRYLHYCLIWGAGWITQPEWEWAATILSDPDLSERNKLALIDAMHFGCAVVPA